MNAVESLFKRLEISASYPAVAAAGIDKIIHLRSLAQDNDKFEALVPDEIARGALRGALARNAAPTGDPAATGAATAGPGEDRGEGRGRGRGRKPRTVCRDFFQGTCDYGDDCRYSHDADQYEREGIPAHEPREHYTEEITVPGDSVKFLLANKCARLIEINKRCGTQNSRIEKPEEFMPSVSFTLKGSKEGVAKAKSEIEHYVGITSQRNREARFNYTQNELEFNQRACQYLAAANVKNQGTPLALSEDVMKSLVSTFRFQPPPKVSQFWLLADKGDKEKFEKLVPLVRPLQGIQAIVFTDANRVTEMAKRAKQTAEAFGVKNPQFVHRGLDKAERMKALEAFKKGEVGENGIRQRLLVTNEDYAKLARKVLIPYVNLTVHFAFPRNKEMYLHQTNCTGRANRPGLSILFVNGQESENIKDLCKNLEIHDLTTAATEFEQASSSLVFDKEDAPLTSPDAEPQDNWQELLEKEKAEKAAKKAAPKPATK